MRVYLVNDTSDFHAGSWAVIASLKQKLFAEGHVVIHATPRPLGPEREWIERCDAVVVNGEGAMQEQEKPWSAGRVTAIMEGLRLAKRLGKKAYLVNSVWYRMNPGWGNVLESLDGLCVREPISQREMERHQGVRPDVFLDLSYSCQLDSTVGTTRFAGKDVIGTLYKRNMPNDGAFSHRNWRFWRMKRLGLGGAAEGRKEPANWSYVINSLRHANLYVTGQHHGVYAACRARVPFAFFRVYNHKIRGLFEWAGVDIPIATDRNTLLEAMQWAATHRDVFERLFDWMEQQPAWPGLGPDRRAPTSARTCCAQDGPLP